MRIQSTMPRLVFSSLTRGITIFRDEHISVSNLTLIFNSLIIAGIVALATVSGAALNYFKVDGDIYNKIMNSKDLAVDILPTPLYLVDAYQKAAELIDSSTDVDAGARRLGELHEAYLKRRSYWARADIDAGLRSRLTIDSYKEGEKFWREIETVFLPALHAGNRELTYRSFEHVKSAYAAHRAIIDDIAKMSGAYIARVKSEAKVKEAWFFFIVFAAAMASLYMAALAISLIRWRLVEPLTCLAAYMSKTPINGERDVPFLHRPDEIGILAKAVDAFRSTVERRILEEQKAHLDAALNNIVQGVEMYGADRRLVLCNARYYDIYGLDRKAELSGKSLRELICLRTPADPQWNESADSLFARIKCALSSPHKRELVSYLADGRCIQIAVRPFADRAGFIITHQDVTEQRKTEERIAYFAHHDALTGLPNRVRLNEELAHALAYARRGEMVAVHILDLDHFKSVNDSLGHPMGDKLLSIVAQRLGGELREADIIARMGGDEFAIVERRVANPSDAASLASRLIDSVSQPYEIDGHLITIGVSIGIAVGPRDGGTGDEIIRNADLALYRAKSDGRGVFRFFEPEMDAKMQERCQLEKDLRNAVLRNEFELRFQPLVHLGDNRICAFEALLRWRHPERGYISPAIFIPLAEETRLIVPVGEWVIKEACNAAANWPGRIKVAVNLSAAQFRSGDVAKVVRDALTSSGLSADRLEIEITESILLDGNDSTLATLHHLRDIGVCVAMDDFGTGYSSLSYLQSFPFNKIKIDKSFIQGIGNDPSSLKIVRAVTTLANGLGIQTTAEGVESSAQLDAVRSEGCAEAQGFLMSKPLTLNEVDSLLRARGESLPAMQKDERMVAAGEAAA